MNPLRGARIARADRGGGRDLACVGEEVVGAWRVVVVVGNLSFERSNFLLELLIVASECVGFKAMDGIAMLNGGNEAPGNVPGAFDGEVVGEDVNCRLRGDGRRDSLATCVEISCSC